MIMDMNTIKKKFAEKHIQLSDDWTGQCLEWISNEFPGLSTEEIEDKVYEEWLGLDLHETEIPVLPPNINDGVVELTLNETIHLQVDFVIDIAMPKYAQLKRMRMSYDDDHHETTNSNRMLKLMLSDGVQDIPAIEYKPIPFLNLNLPPGMKVKLKPPIQIRRGQILLEPDMIELKGGGVDELQISNCPENILATALNLPLSNNPMNTRNNRTDVVSSPVQSTTMSTSANGTGTTTNHTIHRNNSVGDFEDILNDEFFDNHLIQVEEIAEEQASTREPLRQDQHSPITVPSYTNPLYSRQNTNNLSVSTEPAETTTFVEPPTPQRCIMTIEKLNKIRPKVPKGIFTIKAEIHHVVEKLRSAPDGFALKLCVNDETAEMVANAHSNLITELVGLAPDSFCALKSAAATDTVAREQMIEALAKLANRLSNMKAIFSVTVEQNQVPVITEMLESL